LFFIDDENNITEKDIQILYQTHPYLIEQQFLNQKTVPQYSLPSGYADIVIFLNEEIVVIELKVESLNNSHLLQLNEYLEDIYQEFGDIKRIRGILIGKEPMHSLETSIRSLNFEIKILILEDDICTEIKICNNCRLANNINNFSCFNCSYDSFF